MDVMAQHGLQDMTWGCMVPPGTSVGRSLSLHGLKRISMRENEKKPNTSQKQTRTRGTKEIKEKRLSNSATLLSDSTVSLPSSSCNCQDPLLEGGARERNLT